MIIGTEKFCTWFRNRTKALCVCGGCQTRHGSHCSSPTDLQPGPVLHAWARHYLTYYVLGARHTALTSTPGPGLRAHKEIACKLSEKFHHTEHRAASATIWWRFFSFSDYVKICKNDISWAHWQHESDLLHTLDIFMCRCEHSTISVLTKVAESHYRVKLLQHCCLQTFNSPHSWHRCLL